MDVLRDTELFKCPFSSRNRLEPGKFQLVIVCSEFILFRTSRCFVNNVSRRLCFCERPSELYFEVCPCSDVFPFEFV